MRQTLTLNDDFFDEIAQALCTGSEVSDGGAESERRRAGKALRESERRFRDLLETARLISITLDEQGNITFCNDYLLALTGWTQEEILGRNWCYPVCST
jgi:PAS domain-containing protein